VEIVPPTPYWPPPRRLGDLGGVATKEVFWEFFVDERLDLAISWVMFCKVCLYHCYDGCYDAKSIQSPFPFVNDSCDKIALTQK
jgi:hypothetical protein